MASHTKYCFDDDWGQGEFMAPVVLEWPNLSRSIVYCLPFHFVGSIVLDKIAVWRMLWRHWIYDNFSLLSEELFGIYHLCEGELMALHSWHDLHVKWAKHYAMKIWDFFS